MDNTLYGQVPVPPWSAGLAVLSHVSLGTRAHLDPVGRDAEDAASRSIETDVVQVTLA